MKTPDTSAERPHHPYSPSSLQYREACPCYKPSQSTHERTIAGTKGHAVVETGIDDPTLGDKDALAAAACLDFLETRRKLLEQEAQTAWEAECQTYNSSVPAPPPSLRYQVMELKEIYLPVDDLKFPDTDSTTAGYVDRVLLNWNVTYAEMLDWKFGYWQVTDSKDNVQGISYVLGLFKRYPTLQRIKFFFKQPHLDVLTEAEFIRAQIPELYLRVQTIVARAREANKRGDFSMATPYVPACNFCDNLGKCPKVGAFALQVCKKFMPLEFPDSIDLGTLEGKDAASKNLRLAQVLKIYCDARKREITSRIFSGEMTIPAGYDIHTKNGNSTIKNPALFKQVCLKYVTEAEYQSCLEASFGPLDDIISEKAPRMQKTETVKRFRTELEECGAIEKGAQYSYLRVSPSKE